MMDRNAESHFGHIETTNVKRSMFHMPFRNLSTCNAGKIIPFLAYSDILPGDTVKCKTSAVIRMQTPLNPTMDDLFADIYYFAIPKRILWKHWAEFMGEAKDSAWVSNTVYQEPMFTAPASTGVTMGTVADYMGIPKGVTNIQYSELPFRSYVLTYNTWFRRQNLIAPATEYDDDTDRNGSNTTTELGGVPFSASKISDYFTTCAVEAEKPLPGMVQPTIPLGTTAPVFASSTSRTLNSSEKNGMTFESSTALVTGTNYAPTITGDTSVSGGRLRTTDAAAGGTNTYGLYPNNLYADLSQATAATINALRLYFQIQKLFEARSRGGTRLFEILRQEFGTSPSMAVLQLPEYLGGKRQPLNLTQVVQSSATVNNTQALGDTGGMSHTAFTSDDFTKSFQEHSILLGLLIIRQYHTYQQGLHRMWSRRNKLDYYTPVLAHIGEGPVYKKQIKATGTSTDNDVWGFQEAWGEYKYGQQIITGEMNSTYATSLDVWHYGDYYASVPTLAQNWIEETPAYIDRTLAVQSSTAHQFKFDIVSDMVFTRPMPVYNTPGLIDHF